MKLTQILSAVPHTGACGICRFEDLEFSADAKARCLALCPHARAVCVLLFPYLVRDDAPRTLSQYACGRDYHTVLADALDPVCQTLRRDFPPHTFVPLVDASPLPEVQAAWRAGAGILGKNGLIFDRTYGSYVFIGTILTDLDAEPTPSALETCPDCGACRAACPLGALDEQGAVEETRCLSALTQSKGELTTPQRQALAAHPLIWGCDRCSDVCPMNRTAKETENPAFRNNRILTLENVSGLTRREFLRAYPDRAFTWRGPKPLQRNLACKHRQ